MASPSRPPAERFHVELVDVPADRLAGVPVAKRLAQVLKVVLRRAGLRCTSVRRVTAADESEARDV